MKILNVIQKTFTPVYSHNSNASIKTKDKSNVSPFKNTNSIIIVNKDQSTPSITSNKIKQPVNRNQSQHFKQVESMISSTSIIDDKTIKNDTSSNKSPENTKTGKHLSFS